MIATSVAASVAAADQENLSEVIAGAGPISMLFLLLLAGALGLLIWSMRRQLTKIKPDLPEGPIDRGRDADRAVIDDALARGAVAEQRAVKAQAVAKAQAAQAAPAQAQPAEMPADASTDEQPGSEHDQA